MKAFIFFALATLAFCGALELEAPDSVNNPTRELREVETPEVAEEPAVEVPDEEVPDDKVPPKAMRDLDGNTGIPKPPATKGQTVSQIVFHEQVMENGKVLKNIAGGEETVIGKNGEKTVRKFGDSPSSI